MSIQRRTLLGASVATPVILSAGGAMAQARGPIRVAVAGPLTGSNATFGAQMREGATQAVTDLNESEMSRLLVLAERDARNLLATQGYFSPKVKITKSGAIGSKPTVVIDVEPGEQIPVPPGAVFEPGNDTLTFTPSDTAPIEVFEPGIHRVVLTYWKATEGEDQARTFAWTFEAV